MRFTTVRTLVLALAVTAGLASPVAAYDDPPTVEVRLPGPAHQGVDGTFTGTLRVRCAVGDEVSSIHLSFAQQGAGSSEQEVDWLPACTGAWESVGYTSGEGYRAGRSATVAAEVAVADDSGATGAITLARELWVRPAAKVRFADKAVLLDNGSVRARVWIRCDPGWYNYASFVGVVQGTTSAEPSVVEDVECDGDYHRRVEVLAPDTGTFTRGWARVLVDVTLEDLDFEWGPEVDASRRVWVKRG